MATNQTNSAIVGAWNAGGSVVTFLPNGTYFHAQVHTEQNDTYDNAHTPSGIEFGTYSWDSSTGKFSTSILVDTNGLTGFSDVRIDSLTVIDNTLSIKSSDGEMAVPRITSSTNPIVGSWSFTHINAGDSTQGIFTFLADGTYFQVETGKYSDSTAHEGMERGIYSWNSSTGSFSATALVDTNGDAGVSGATFPMPLTISGDTANFAGMLSLTRVGSQSNDEIITPVVEVTALPTNHPLTGALKITGTTAKGGTLTATNSLKDADGLGEIHYQWLKNGEEILDATAKTYKIAGKDVESKISVIASYTDKLGFTESVTSKSTAVIRGVLSKKPTSGDDQLTGNVKNEKFDALDGDDLIKAMGGKDTLIGGNGDDTLIGGEGVDKLTGGAGKDIFKLESVKESGAAVTTRDTITDFNHNDGDKIDLSAIDANVKLAGNQAFKFIGAEKFSADASAQVRFDVKTHILSGSTNAANAAEFSITLTGVNVLVAADFVL